MKRRIGYQKKIVLTCKENLYLNFKTYLVKCSSKCVNLLTCVWYDEKSYKMSLMSVIPIQEEKIKIKFNSLEFITTPASARCSLLFFATSSWFPFFFALLHPSSPLYHLKYFLSQIPPRIYARYFFSPSVPPNWASFHLTFPSFSSSTSYRVWTITNFRLVFVDYDLCLWGA